MKKIKILLSGASGRLCSVIAKMVAEKEDCEIVCGVDVFSKDDSSFPIYKSFSKIPSSTKADVIIDCSHHTLAESVTEYAVKTNTPAVICTTGQTDEEMNIIKSASEKIAILKSGNMSLGINLLMELTKKAAQILGEDYDIEIIEQHHNKKLDAPSGTALMLANAAAEGREESMKYVYERHSVKQAREKSEIGISSIRGGTIVGEHEVLFAGQNERIKLSHSAESRDLFATGAIKAALWICGKEASMYSMSDVIKEMLD